MRDYDLEIHRIQDTVVPGTFAVTQKDALNRGRPKLSLALMMRDVDEGSTAKRANVIVGRGSCVPKLEQGLHPNRFAGQLIFKIESSHYRFPPVFGGHARGCEEASFSFNGDPMSALGYPILLWGVGSRHLVTWAS